EALKSTARFLSRETSHDAVRLLYLAFKGGAMVKETQDLKTILDLQYLAGLDIITVRSEEHTSELQSRFDLVCRLLLEKKKVHQLNLASIVPSALQPRKDFAREALQELIDSIRQHGIIQPLIVRQVGARLELISGERRWRAAQEAGLTQVPVIIRSASDPEVLAISLNENLQRADLNPLEEAQGYARLANELGMPQ